MSKPKKWDTMTEAEQEAWKANKRSLQNARRQKNIEKCRENERKRRAANPEIYRAHSIKHRQKIKLMTEEDQEKRRKHDAELQRIRYHANREKSLETARKYRERKKAIKDAEKAKPAKLDMSKVLAFIGKKDGPKSQKPITPNMAKVREFIKYA